MKIKTAIFLSVLGLTTFTGLFAEQGLPQRNGEVTLAYDLMSPDSVYDDWKTAEFRYFHRFNPNNAMVLITGMSQRNEDLAWLQGATYRDWLPRLYTYSSVGLASKTEWMGRLRFDNTLFFKMGKKQSFVVSTGQTIISYDEHKPDFLLSAGYIYYFTHVVFEGNAIFNKAFNKKSWFNTVNLTISGGTQGKYWIVLHSSTAAQDYWSISNLAPIGQNVNSVNLNQQIWFNSESGIKTGLGYLKVKSAYEKIHFSLGYFHNL